jgi:hypothetical protein
VLLAYGRGFLSHIVTAISIPKLACHYPVWKIGGARPAIMQRERAARTGEFSVRVVVASVPAMVFYTLRMKEASYFERQGE